MMKKLYLFLLIFALFGSFIITPKIALAGPGRSDLLRDGAMNNPDMTEWQQWGAANANVVMQKELNDSDNYEGNRMVHMRAQNTNAGIQQLNIPVQAGGMYKLRMLYRVQTGKLMPLFGIHSSNRDFQNRQDFLVPTHQEDGEQWSEYTRIIKIPDNFQGDFRLVLVLYNGEAFIDDILIQDYTDYVFWSFDHDYDYLVRDPNMALHGRAHWVPYGAPRVLEKRQRLELPEGQYDRVLHIDSTGTNAGAQQLNIPVEAGKRYRLRFSYQLTGGTLQPLLGIRGSNQDFENVLARLRPNNEWQEYERSFTIPENFTNDFRIALIVRNGEAYIDNMMLKDITDPASTEVGALTVTPGRRTVDSVVVLGERNARIGEVELLASGSEDINVQELTMKVSIIYENEPNLLDNFSLYDGEQLISQGEAVLRPDHAVQMVTFQNMNVLVSRDQPRLFTIKADVAPEAEGIRIIGERRPYTVSVLSTIDGRRISVKATGNSSNLPIRRERLFYSLLTSPADGAISPQDFFLQRTEISAELAEDPISPIVPTDDALIGHLRITNHDNAQDAPAHVYFLGTRILPSGVELPEDLSVKVYQERVDVDHLISSAPLEFFEIDNGNIRIASANFSFDDNFVIPAGETKDLYFTLDLSNAVEGNDIQFGFHEIRWHDDANLRTHELNLRKDITFRVAENP